MWDEAKQQQLNELQRQAQEGRLTEQEKQAFEQLVCELEQEEWNALPPALERLQGEREQEQKQEGRLRLENSVVAALAERQEDLLRRARGELTALVSEHEALKAEYERLIGQPLRESLA